MKLSKLRIGALALVFAVFFTVLGAGAALAAVQSHMLQAQKSLNSALSDLEAAQPDKGGHRNNAINLVKQALDQVSAGLQAAK